MPVSGVSGTDPGDDRDELAQVPAYRSDPTGLTSDAKKIPGGLINCLNGLRWLTEKQPSPSQPPLRRNVSRPAHNSLLPETIARFAAANKRPLDLTEYDVKAIQSFSAQTINQLLGRVEWILLPAGLERLPAWVNELPGLRGLTIRGYQGASIPVLNPTVQTLLVESRSLEVAYVLNGVQVVPYGETRHRPGFRIVYPPDPLQTFSSKAADTPGLVFQNPGSMSTSQDDQATLGRGKHRVVIQYAEGAAAIDTFTGNPESSLLDGEAEITTLPGARFVVLGRAMVPDIEHRNGQNTRLELEVLMLPPDATYVSNLTVSNNTEPIEPADGEESA